MTLKKLLKKYSKQIIEFIKYSWGKLLIAGTGVIVNLVFVDWWHFKAWIINLATLPIFYIWGYLYTKSFMNKDGKAKP